MKGNKEKENEKRRKKKKFTIPKVPIEFSGIYDIGASGSVVANIIIGYEGIMFSIILPILRSGKAFARIILYLFN